MVDFGLTITKDPQTLIIVLVTRTTPILIMEHTLAMDMDIIHTTRLDPIIIRRLIIQRLNTFMLLNTGTQGVATETY